MIKKIAGLGNLQKLLKSSPKVIIDFNAEWCGPCKQISPYFEKISKNDDFKNIQFAKVDIDDNEDICQEFEISSVPTFISITNESELSRFSGADPTKLEDSIKKLEEA